MENLHLLSVLIDKLEEAKQILNAEISSLREKLMSEGVGQLGIENEIREKESRLALITEDTIEKYKARWNATTPSDWLPCPFCYTFHNKDSRLEPLPEKNGFEFVKCTVCKEKFPIPIPKF